MLDVGLDRRARRCVLAHELVHAERGIGHGAATLETMEREEEVVRREVARRLVPTAALRSMVLRLGVDASVELTAVCDEFDVEPDVALTALSMLDRGPAA